MGFPDQLNMAEERDPVELGMALGADSNMKEDSVTAKKRAKRWEITADASMEREKGTLDQDEDEDDLCVGERLGFSDQSNGSKERDLVDQLGMALGADSNMKEDKVTIEKWRAVSTLRSSDSIMADVDMEIAMAPAMADVDTEISMAPAMADVDMEIEGQWQIRFGLRASSYEYKDAKHKKLMDRRMHAQATQGNLDGFKNILGSISSEQDLQHSEILCQVSPRKNTCHIFVREFGIGLK